MLAEACVPVATHRHGCCVLQRAMDAATPEQARLLVSKVCLNALLLMQVSGVARAFLCFAGKEREIERGEQAMIQWWVSLTATRESSLLPS